ncbi:60S acidic ribosomal protein P2B [Glycine max]|nr:60S acidic ribosomal protein P2B [Glycine max]
MFYRKNLFPKAFRKNLLLEAFRKKVLLEEQIVVLPKSFQKKVLPVEQFILPEEASPEEGSSDRTNCSSGRTFFRRSYPEELLPVRVTKPKNRLVSFSKNKTLAVAHALPQKQHYNNITLRSRRLSLLVRIFTLSLSLRKMKVVAAYLLAVLGGNNTPSADDIKEILGSVGIEADEDRIESFLSEVKGKDIVELIAAGKEKLASVPSGGGGAVAVAAAPGGGGGGAAPAAEVKKEEKVEEKEESDDDMGFSLFD